MATVSSASNKNDEDYYPVMVTWTAPNFTQGALWFEPGSYQRDTLPSIRSLSLSMLGLQVKLHESLGFDGPTLTYNGPGRYILPNGFLTRSMQLLITRPGEAPAGPGWPSGSGVSGPPREPDDDQPLSGRRRADGDAGSNRPRGLWVRSTTPVPKSFDDFADEVRDALQGTDSAAWPHDGSIAATQDANALAAALLGAIAASSPQPSDSGEPVAGKAMTMPLSLSDPSLLTSKDFMGGVLSTVQSLSPIVLNAIGQATATNGKGWGVEDAVALVAPERRDDEGWINFVTGTIQALGAPLLQAMTGQKDFTTTDVPTLEIPAEHIDDKDWIDDALNFATSVLPSVLPMLLTAI